jgi:hypothetical protein
MQYRITGANAMGVATKGDVLPSSSRCSLMLGQYGSKPMMMQQTEPVVI